MGHPTSASLRFYTDAFWFSPYTFAVFVALREKGLLFETTELALHRGESEEPDFRRRSVTGRVPALKHGDFFLAESSAIIDYLDEKFPAPVHAPLLPLEIEKRARARMVLAWIRSSRDLLPLIEERSTATMFYEKAKEPLSPKAKESADRLVEVADLLVPSDSGPLFGNWSIADSDLAFSLHRLILNDHPIPARIRRYAEDQWLRPSVQEFVGKKRTPYVPY